MSRELILPAIRLDVPPRPSKQQLAALAERSAEQWTTGPLALATQHVVRLAVAAALQARLAPGPGRGAGRGVEDAVPTDPEQVTLAQLATLFRPHVGLAAQAFELAVVEAVNAGVPAATDPVREGLRRIGVTGREPLRMVALGLDKLPPRARPAFWESVRTSTTLTAIVDALAVRRGDARPHDVSGLDRSQLARADALLLGGGRVTPVALTSRAPEGGSWLQVPLALTRRGRGPGSGGQGDAGRRGGDRGERGVEVTLQGEAWTEVFEAALDALGSAMQQIDTGSRPRGRSGEVADALATRLVAARDRTVADVCASLRGIDEFALELFDHQVTTSAVPVAVPAIEDDLFVQLWLPTSALAGPLFTGAPDLFLGGAADVRGAARGADTGSGKGSGRGSSRGSAERPSGGGPRPGGRGGRPGARPEGQQDDRSGPRSGRRRKPRPGPDGAPDAPAGASPDPAAGPAQEPAPEPASSPATGPTPTPTSSPAPTPSPESVSPITPAEATPPGSAETA